MARTKHKDATTITIIERQDKALAYRRQGYSLRRIAAELRVSHEQIRLDIEAALEAAREEMTQGAISLILLEKERLERMLVGLNERQNKGDFQAIDAALKIHDRLAKLGGLNAPDRLQVEVDVTKLSDAELEALARGDTPQT